MNVIVCGGRNFDNWPVVLNALNELHAANSITQIIQGGARGADELAARWACAVAKINLLTVRAEWEKYGRRAGPLRNASMLEEKPDLVVAFPGGKGTADMVRQAKRAGVRVIEVG